jgi:TRAP-type C4-dicarboxylate transport system substrate-binding protein
MQIRARGLVTGIWIGAALFSLATRSAALAADEKRYVMKISLATVGDLLHEFAKDYAAAVEKDSNGRIKVEIYPSSQLGSTQRQVEGVQFGEIQALVAPPEFLNGIDERFAVLAAPGLVTSLAAGRRLTADPAVRKLMLGLGDEKGLHGVALFPVAPSSVISRTPIRRLADFNDKKIRVFASPFQTVAVARLGATPKPMTLGDVLPALQDNAIDAAVSSITVFTTMRYWGAAKYVTEIGQPVIFGLAEISKKWFDSLPSDLQQIVDTDAATQAAALAPRAEESIAGARRLWTEHGGELITLPPDDQSAMLKALASVGEDISKAKPQLNAAYRTVTDAARRIQ